MVYLGRLRALIRRGRAGVLRAGVLLLASAVSTTSAGVSGSGGRVAAPVWMLVSGATGVVSPVRGRRLPGPLSPIGIMVGSITAKPPTTCGTGSADASGNSPITYCLSVRFVGP